MFACIYGENDTYAVHIGKKQTDRTVSRQKEKHAQTERERDTEYKRTGER